MSLPAAHTDRTIEVLYFDGCPNFEDLVLRLPELLDRAGVTGEIELRKVESDEGARDSRFLGSPTVRVDGRDIEPDADRRTDYGLKCRLYRTPTGSWGSLPTP